MTIGQTIAKMRKDRGLNQKRLAQLARVSSAHLCLIESDKRQPSLRVLARLSTAVGMQVRLKWVKL